MSFEQKPSETESLPISIERWSHSAPRAGAPPNLKWEDNFAPQESGRRMNPPKQHNNTMLYPPHPFPSTSRYLNGAANFFASSEDTVRDAQSEVEDYLLKTAAIAPYTFPQHRHGVKPIGPSPVEWRRTKEVGNAAAIKWKDITFNDALVKKAYVNYRLAKELTSEVKAYVQDLDIQTTTTDAPAHVGAEVLRFAMPKLGAAWEVFDARKELPREALEEKEIGSLKETLTPPTVGNLMHYTFAPFFCSKGDFK